MIESKVCRKCGVEKNGPCFSKSKRYKDGLWPYCKECEKARKKEWGEKNQEKIKAYSAKYGLENRERLAEKSRNYRKNNRDKVLAGLKEWRLKKKDQVKEYQKGWRTENRSHKSEYAKKYWEKNSGSQRERHKFWIKSNREKVNIYARSKKARKLKAIPKWADRKAINEVYRRARELEKQDGIKRHVDHIIPLQGRNVCGLHVENNLRIITATENLKKHIRLLEDIAA
jgi:hypothetical protein